MSTKGLRGQEGFAHKVTDDGSLERCDQIERFCVAKWQNIAQSGVFQRRDCPVAGIYRGLHAVNLDVAKNRSFDAAEREQVARQCRSLAGPMDLGFHLRERECDSTGVAVGG